MTTKVKKQGTALAGLLTEEELKIEINEFILDRAPTYAPPIADTIRRELRGRLVKALRTGGRLSDMKRAVIGALEGAVGQGGRARAARIARTEVVGAFNAGATIQYAGNRDRVDRKQWVTARDSRVRDDHRAADGQTVRVGESFRVGGDFLLYPGDPKASARQIVNCRCTVLPVLRGQAPPVQPVTHPIQSPEAPRSEPKPEKRPIRVGGQKVPISSVPQPPAPDAAPAPSRTKEQQAQKETDMKTLRWKEKTRLRTGGTSEAYKVTLTDDTQAVFKPGIGETDDLRTAIPDNTGFKREAASYDVAKIMEMDDLVPVSVITNDDLTNEIGSIQEWVTGSTAKEAGMFQDATFNGPKDHARAAAFDYAIGNTDRHGGNWIVRNSGPKKGSFALIDNGLSFPLERGTPEGLYNKRIILKAGERGLTIPQDEIAKWNDRWSEIETALVERGIEQDAIDNMRDRLDILANTDRFEDLIQLDSDLQVGNLL